jgi:hypothetical protein
MQEGVAHLVEQWSHDPKLKCLNTAADGTHINEN